MQRLRLSRHQAGGCCGRSVSTKTRRATDSSTEPGPELGYWTFHTSGACPGHFVDLSSFQGLPELKEGPPQSILGPIWG